MLAFLLKWWKEVNMPKRAQDPGDEAGRLDPIGPHGPNPPSHGRVSRGDVGAEAEVNFDDDEIYSGNNTRRGGTSKSSGAKARPRPFSTTISPPLAGVRPKPSRVEMCWNF